ncbi:MAG TPA: hypothetical protein VF857_09465 [Spirochaetota bacterium]
MIIGRSNESALNDDISRLIAENGDKRIIVVGTSCTGKSTLVKNHPEYRDMDDLIFPLLTKAEADFVCQTPWTVDIGRKMDDCVRERVKSKKGAVIWHCHHRL